MIIELIILITIFIIGILLGSFFTLAIYRIPLHQDITHTRSYCPKCGNKLKFLDLIPVLSYVFLKGKCRYCKEKIKPRYIIIEVLSGLLYLLFYLSLKIDILNLDINKIIMLVFGTVFISTLFIIGGIEKETRMVSKGVLIFGIISELIYITYLYIFKINIYRYIIYITILVILQIFNIILPKLKYTTYILSIIAISLIATNELVTILSVVITIFIYLILKLKKQKNIPIISYLSFLNIITYILYNFYYLR